jgi:hypothetical protein
MTPRRLARKFLDAIKGTDVCDDWCKLGREDGSTSLRRNLAQTLLIIRANELEVGKQEAREFWYANYFLQANIGNYIDKPQVKNDWRHRYSHKYTTRFEGMLNEF